MSEGNLGDWKPEGEGVCAHRIHYQAGYRIYFGRDGNRLVILLGGGSKRRQQRDIRAAQRLWKIYKARKRSTK